ncbi:MAG: 23S rRNA (guanosine(2251)-2'-O)-methyltransferase RlmB [Nannocystaceae bacterium]
MVPGERAVVELMRDAPKRVQRLHMEAGRTMDEIERLAATAGLAIQRCARAELDDLVGPGLARGVVAQADSPVLGDMDELFTRAGHRSKRTRLGRRVFVALDGVQDPQNLGAIIRSAEFFGAQGLFYARDRAAPLSPSAVRASAGASERLPLACLPNLARALEQCKQSGYWVVGTVVDSGQDAAQLCAQLPDDFVLVMGSEERGLRRLTRDRCDFLASIPGQAEVGSLNVAAAAAVALALLA